METRFYITIGREKGAGGLEIAKRLSEELNWETEFAKLMAAERQMMS